MIRDQNWPRIRRVSYWFTIAVLPVPDWVIDELLNVVPVNVPCVRVAMLLAPS